MSCVKCNSAILCETDNVGYSCGHRYHTACIFKTKMSIHKPTCPACGVGTMIYVQSKNNETNLEKNRGPQLIHYLFALILIIFAILHFLFRT